MTTRLLCDDPSMRWGDALTSLHGTDYETDVSVSGDEETDDGLYYRWWSEKPDGMILRRKRYHVASDSIKVGYMRTKFGIFRSCSRAYLIYEFMEINRDNGQVHFRTPLRRELVVKWTDGSYSRKHLDQLRKDSWLLPYNLQPGRDRFL